MACPSHPHLSHVAFGACIDPATALADTGTNLARVTHGLAGNGFAGGPPGTFTALLNCSLSCTYPYAQHGGVPWVACGRQMDGPAHWLVPPAVPQPLQCHLQWDWQVACVGAVAAVFAVCLLAVTIQEWRTPYHARVDKRNKWKLEQLGWTVVRAVTRARVTRTTCPHPPHAEVPTAMMSNVLTYVHSHACGARVGARGPHSLCGTAVHGSRACAAPGTRSSSW